MINLSKNQPKYLYKLNVALVCFFAFWFTAVVAVMIAIGCIYGESVITYAVMGGGFALFFIGLAIFWLIDNKLYKRFLGERTAELEKEFSEMPFEEAERILKERGIITDAGFVVNDGVFGGETVPFEKAYFIFKIDTVAGVELKIVLYTEGDGPKTVYAFDRAMYNYVLFKDTNLKDNETLKLLREDKKAFTQTVLRYTKTFQWKFK